MVKLFSIKVKLKKWVQVAAPKQFGTILLDIEMLMSVMVGKSLIGTQQEEPLAVDLAGDISNKSLHLINRDWLKAYQGWSKEVIK